MSGYSSLSTELREQLRREASHFANHEDVDSLMDYVEAVLLYGKDRDGMCQELSEILGEDTRYFVDRLYDLIDEMVQSNLSERKSSRINEVNEEECLVNDDIEGQSVQDDQLKETDESMKRKRSPIEKEAVKEDFQEEGFIHDAKRRDHRNAQQSMDKEIDKKFEKTGMSRKEKLKANVDARLKALQEKKKVQALKGKVETGTSQESKFRYRHGKASQQYGGDRCEPGSEKFKNGGRNYGHTKSLHYKSHGADHSERAREENEQASDDPSLSEKKDFPVKCKFFPACTNENCQYYHPTENCRKFPNCPLGQACMYIHPTIPCKFGAFCTRGAECPFLHYSRPNYMPPMYPMPNTAPLCKNGFSCTTPRCVFSHPIEACRFGAACKNKFCTFSHARPCRNGSTCNIPGCTFAHGKFLIQAPEKETTELAAAASKAHSSSDQAPQYTDECDVNLNPHPLENNTVEVVNEN